jgi:hypothetical protein
MGEGSVCEMLTERYSIRIVAEIRPHADILFNIG